jgi:hypothetical protein
MTLHITITITFPPETGGFAPIPHRPDQPPTPWRRLVALCGGDRVAARRLTCTEHRRNRNLTWDEAVGRALLRQLLKASRP